MAGRSPASTDGRGQSPHHSGSPWQPRMTRSECQKKGYATFSVYHSQDDCRKIDVENHRSTKYMYINSCEWPQKVRAPKWD